MSYRIEPTSKTTQDIVIDGWEKGISAGPYQIFVPSALGPITQTGMVDLSYGNIIGIPGEFSVNFPLTASTIVTSGGVAMVTPIQIATEIDAGSGGTVSAYYLLDGKGQVFSTPGTLSAGAITWTWVGQAGSNSVEIIGNSGMVWWQGFLFVIRGTKIYYSPDGGVTLTDWTSTVDPTGLLLAGSTHYAISQKTFNTFMVCNGPYIFSVTLNFGSTFDPTNAATYTSSFNNLLPSYDMATCLAEINGQILIGGALNRVYPWDAQATSGVANAASFVGQPLFTGDRYIQRIVVVNSNAYIFCGHPIIPTGRGYIYISNGSTMDVFQKMPDNFTSIAGGNGTIQTPYWRFGDAMWHRNQLMFGAAAYSNLTGLVVADTGGVWGLDINSNALYRANLMTSGFSSLPTVMNPFDIGTTIPGMGYMCGQTGVMNNATTLLGTPARIISDKIPAGTFLNKATYEQIEVKMAVPMVAGESVAVNVITDLGFTSLGTMTSADGVGKVFTPIANQQNLQWIQLEAILTPSNTSPTYVRLREMRIR